MLDRFDDSGTVEKTIEKAAETTRDVLESTDTDLSPEEIAKILEDERKRTEKLKKEQRR